MTLGPVLHHRADGLDVGAVGRGAAPVPGVLILALAAFAVPAGPAAAQGSQGSDLPEIRVHEDESGQRLQVDGRDFFVQGMNWDYFPVGTTYSYSLWTQPDDVIEAALAREMPLVASMGVNAVRQYAGVPPRWVRHIHDRYGIYTVLNHPVGRYGVTVDGVFHPNTDYSDPRQRAQLLGEIEALVDEFEGVPGVLMWLLGNENNYGLVWNSPETADLPTEERDALRARYLYSLFGEAAELIKGKDPMRPVAMANGDLGYVDIIAEEVRALDIFGSNVYRGVSFRDFFEEVREKLGVPVLFTEFGADAFNSREMREDQEAQTYYLLGQWREIYENTAGQGLAENAIGGLTFQWSDGWWKFGQEDNLDVQDVNASWANDAYPHDFVAGDNNMNEEWWGIAAKGRPDHRGLYELYPRAAFYALREVYELDPYADATDLSAIRSHFAGISPAVAALQARGDRAQLGSENNSRVRVQGIRVELEGYGTGGSSVSTPANGSRTTGPYPNYTGFGQKQSFYATLAANPSPSFEATLSLNVLGEVPTNPIDEIFYENRGRTRYVPTADGGLSLGDLERVKAHGATVSWDEPWFRLDGFHRTGHYHWGYEGDFFGLYQEANYGPNIDVYNAQAPSGIEFQGKRALGGLKVAAGPELWWGANPSVLAKYQRQAGPFQATVIFQEDLARQDQAFSSFAIPVPPTRKTTLHLEATSGPFTLDLGGIWSGSTKVGQTFQVARGQAGNRTVGLDEVLASDAFGGKFKLTKEGGRVLWYLQGAMMGVVADGGPTQTLTFTGWHLKDSGSGNQMNALAGMAINLGSLQVAPNVLWQEPLIGPVPADVPIPGRPRNILDDPFAVRANRASMAGELLLTFDPTPATWMYSWDSDMREDASFAASVGFVYRSFSTTQDASIGFLADGRTTFAFPGAPPARDLWEARARILSKRTTGPSLIANLYTGTGEARGDDARLVRRHGAELRVVSGSMKLSSYARVNDWGPYDYHRDFNLTFPLQLMGDLSYTLGTPEWWDVPESRLGIRFTWRSLDRHSPRYCPASVTGPTGVAQCDPNRVGPRGREWEIRTYLHVGA